MSEQVKIEFSTRNAAFGEEPASEIARILHSLADRISSGMATDEMSLRDINGNRVGFCRITTEREG